MSIEAPNMAAFPQAPIEQVDFVPQDQAAETSRRAALWGKVKQAAGRLALGVAVLAGGTGVAVAATEKPAQAASDYDCYGDYCTGLYAGNTQCAEDAETLETAYISKTGDSISVSAGPVSVGRGGDTAQVGRLQLRWSDKCGTGWARLNTNSASDINFIGVQHSGGYAKERRIAGLIQGSPSGMSVSPMVYSRKEDFQAYASVKGGLFTPPKTVGTYWAKG